MNSDDPPSQTNNNRKRRQPAAAAEKDETIDCLSSSSSSSSSMITEVHPTAAPDDAAAEESSPWSPEIHRSFVEAVYSIGMNHASPAVIMDFMTLLDPEDHKMNRRRRSLVDQISNSGDGGAASGNTKTTRGGGKSKRGVTNERVKSHLQKYRLNGVKSKHEFMEQYDAWMRKALTIGGAANPPGCKGTNMPLLHPSTVIQIMGGSNGGPTDSSELLGGERAAWMSYATLAEEYSSPTMSAPVEKLPFHHHGKPSLPKLPRIASMTLLSSIDDGEVRTKPPKTSQKVQPSLEHFREGSEEYLRQFTGMSIPYPNLTESERSSSVGMIIQQVLDLFHMMTQYLIRQRLSSTGLVSEVSVSEQNVDPFRSGKPKLEENPETIQPAPAADAGTHNHIPQPPSSNNQSNERKQQVQQIREKPSKPPTTAFSAPARRGSDASLVASHSLDPTLAKRGFPAAPLPAPHALAPPAPPRQDYRKQLAREARKRRKVEVEHGHTHIDAEGKSPFPSHPTSSHAEKHKLTHASSQRPAPNHSKSEAQKHQTRERHANPKPSTNFPTPPRRGSVAPKVPVPTHHHDAEPEATEQQRKDQVEQHHPPVQIQEAPAPFYPPFPPPPHNTSYHYVPTHPPQHYHYYPNVPPPHHLTYPKISSAPTIPHDSRMPSSTAPRSDDTVTNRQQHSPVGMIADEVMAAVVQRALQAEDGNHRVQQRSPAMEFDYANESPLNDDDHLPHHHPHHDLLPHISMDNMTHISNQTDVESIENIFDEFYNEEETEHNTAGAQPNESF